MTDALNAGARAYYENTIEKFLASAPRGVDLPPRGIPTWDELKDAEKQDWFDQVEVVVDAVTDLLSADVERAIKRVPSAAYELRRELPWIDEEGDDPNGASRGQG